MSGHSKWATTKRAKAVVDAKRGAAFTKLSNLITIAARKGADPKTNFALAQAIERARAINMPKDNIERAIKRGTGEGDGAQIEELVYEGFGPAGTQFIVRVLTDNRNRAAANIRHLFSQHGGSLGVVMWNFERKNNPESGEIEYLAKTTMPVLPQDHDKVQTFIDALEDDEDISDYFTNAV